MPRPRAALLSVGLAVVLSGCGGGSRYANAPSPPTPTLVAAAITASGVSLSPDHFGAGLVQLVVTNLTASSQQLTVRSTEGRTFAQQTAPINPADTAELKAELGAGRYTVSVMDAGVKAARLAVAARRPSSSNGRLLP
ncbi:MAG: hypothetical protein QOF77_2288 [Solirubrobacteraceae bacterium]|jgi:hypothetical protein|nr:hypothetical protein [Solirubrobacteraceae bacterium]